MAGSSSETPTRPDVSGGAGGRPPGGAEPVALPVGDVRASDAERDAVVARLTEEFAAGRLSHDTFLFRMNAVLEARHQADLPPLLADLPATPGRPPGLVRRLRTALPRRPRSGATISGDTDLPSPSPRNSPARRLTAGMPRAIADARRPVSLQFPRGSGPLFSIGRDAGCDLAIPDMTVSRIHARLERTSDGWLLTDLGSTNGTRVNGWLVRGQVRVWVGDLVSFGEAEYWLSAADAI